MAVDPELFFARRVGFGLKAGEKLPADLRGWAVEQLKTVPAMDYYSGDGADLRSELPEDPKPLDYADAAYQWGIGNLVRLKLEKEMASASPEEFWKRSYAEEVYPYSTIPHWREGVLRALTAVNGPAPVFERFHLFWLNHFATGFFNNTFVIYYGPHSRAIRNRLTGNFADLLRDAVLNPAMYAYLDNISSTGPNAKNGDGSRNKGNLNENFARELLELHTVSPAAGYTQADVIEAALLLTGWAINVGYLYDKKGNPKADPKVDPKTLGPYFEWWKHEPGVRTVMGKTYKEKKKNSGSQAADFVADLAVHPSTARHISFKLARHFIADDPPQECVDRIVSAWETSGGDLVAIHSAVIDEVLTFGAQYEKFSTPEVWFYTASRTAGAPVPLNIAKAGMGREDVTTILQEIGQPYDEVPQPNGWSDLAADWVSKELLDRRIKYANRMGRSIKDDQFAFLKETAERLTDADSDLMRLIKTSKTRSEVMIYLFLSPEFLKI